MREIEIKAKCSDTQSLIMALREQGITVSDPIVQDDRVFGLPGEFGDNINQAPWLRIRREARQSGERTIFTMKKSVTSQLDSIEHETEITNGDECENIVLHLGFVPYVRVKKTRQKAQLGDIELCIDQVEGLGGFVEAEKLTSEDADYDVVIDELWTIFERFDISRKDRVLDGYDVLIKHKGENE